MRISFRLLAVCVVVMGAFAAQGCGDSASTKPVTPEQANEIMKPSMKGTGPMVVPPPMPIEKAK